MANKNKEKVSKLQRKRVILLWAALVIFVLFLISTVFQDWLQIIDNRKQTKDFNAYYQELLEEQASLNSEVVKLQDPEYVARYAREKYMYTKDGETILKIIDGKVVKGNDGE